MINYIIGDVRSGDRTSPIVMIPHCCNDDHVIGSGVAGALCEKWPTVRNKYMSSVCHLGYVTYVKVDNDKTIIANMIGQHSTMVGRNKNGVAVGEDGRPPVRYAALANAMGSVAGWLERFDHECEVHCPMFGCDLAGGNWDFVSELIEEIWCPHSKVTCFIHESKKEQYRHLLSIP